MMTRKTKIERGILYKNDYKKLKEYKERLAKSAKAQISYRLGRNDLTTIKDIYEKYHPKEIVDMNCNKCLMKMINRTHQLINRYEKQK